jgi:drug/metabolite transporter (DMT)-like permease
VSAGARAEPAPAAAGGGVASPVAVWGALGVVYVVWGSTYLAIRVMVETAPPLLAAGARFGLAGLLVLGALALRFGRARVRLTRREWAGCAVVGLLLPAGGNGLVTVAERDVPSALAALIIASVPLWVAVWRAGARERLDRVALLGVLAGFLGVALLLLPGNRPDGATTVGMLLCVLAAASWATGSFLSGRLALPADPFAATGAEMVCGGAVLVACGLAAGEVGELGAGTLALDGVLAFLYLVVFGSLLAYTAYVWLLQHAPVAQVATYAYVNPVVAVLLGWAILDETISGLTLLGAAVIVGSVALTVTREAHARSG